MENLKYVPYENNNSVNFTVAGKKKRPVKKMPFSLWFLSRRGFLDGRQCGRQCNEFYTRFPDEGSELVCSEIVVLFWSFNYDLQPWWSQTGFHQNAVFSF